MLKIAICEDDSYFLKYSSKIITECFQHCSEECTVELYSDSTIFLNVLKQRQYFDVIFLDIDMPETDGITIGAFLRKTEAETYLIYLSDREELVFDTFKTQPFSFIPKTRFQEKIQTTVNAVCHAYLEQSPTATLTINGMHYQWDLRKLVYVECINKTLYLHFTDYTLQIFYQIGLLEQDLASYGFIRVHKGYLVNYRFIFCIEKDCVRLDTQKTVPLSKHRAVAVKKAFLEWTF